MLNRTRLNESTLRRYGLCLLATFALFAMTAARAGAQMVKSEPYVWKSVTIGAGGYIPGIEFSPVQKNLAYCRTDIGGPYKWDQSQKRWLPLLDWCGTYNYFGIESIAPDPVDPNKMYMACGMYGNAGACIMRTSDQGKTFQIAQVPFTMGGNENGRGMGERLAVNPVNTSILFFGSRHDGLWQSTDGAVSWKKVDSFPAKVNGRGRGGLSFVLFTHSSRHSGAAEIYVGNAEQGQPGLYRSSDAGATWQAVPGQPPEKIFPTHASIDSAGVIYFSYADSPPPSGASDGDVWKLNSQDGTWTDITPIKPNADGQPSFGYGNISVDQHNGIVICSTIQRDTKPGGDDLLRSTDGGKTWKSVNQTPNLLNDRDISATPYLKTLANPEQWFGWWMSAVAIDPFDSDHACYATGATIYNTNDITRMDSGKTSHWNTWTDGIEETADLCLLSPTEGPHLYTGFGDVGGFVHDDLDKTPSAQFLNPKFGNTQAIEYAGLNPKVVVRNGTASGQGSEPFGWSEDYGKTWKPLSVPKSLAPATQLRVNGGRPGGPGRGRGPAGFGDATPSLIVSADGSTFMLLSPAAQFTRDHGSTWTPVTGLPPASRVVADRRDAAMFYSLDFAGKRVFTSMDGGATFTASPIIGVPDELQTGGGGGRGGAGPHLWQGIDRSGDLWAVGGRVMLHSTDGGRSFISIQNAPAVAGAGRAFGLGKAAPGASYPSIFVAGTMNHILGVFRSDDMGRTWARISDDQHQYGNGFVCVTGDPRVYGRVYVGFNGRGVLYGDIATR